MHSPAYVGYVPSTVGVRQSWTVLCVAATTIENHHSAATLCRRYDWNFSLYSLINSQTVIPDAHGSYLDWPSELPWTYINWIRPC